MTSSTRNALIESCKVNVPQAGRLQAAELDIIRRERMQSGSLRKT